MMYCEFIERTKYGESYITESMYHEYIEPAYMAAPETVNKDIFCKDFYKLESQAVTTVITGLIAAKPLDDKCGYIAGLNEKFEDIEKKHTLLKQIFLEAFSGIYKNYCRDHYKQ